MEQHITKSCCYCYRHLHIGFEWIVLYQCNWFLVIAMLNISWNSEKDQQGFTITVLIHKTDNLSLELQVQRNFFLNMLWFLMLSLFYFFLLQLYFFHAPPEQSEVPTPTAVNVTATTWGQSHFFFKFLPSCACLWIKHSLFKPWVGTCVVFLSKTPPSHSAPLHPSV